MVRALIIGLLSPYPMERIMNYQEAISFMRKEFESGRFSGVIGYKNQYRTESAIDAALMLEAYEVTGCSKLDIYSWDNGFYSCVFRLPIDVIMLIECEDQQA